MSWIASIDEKVLLWITGLAGTSFFDNLMRFVVNDYFILISISLALVALWFIGKT